MTFKGKSYAAGHVLSVTLDPYQVAQVQSTANLSGSKVTASSPVAVLSGHSWPAEKLELQPCGRAAATHICLGHPLRSASVLPQPAHDVVYVMASQATKLTYHLGGTTRSQRLQAGKVAKFEIQQSRPLYLSAGVGIQVLMFGRSAKTERPYDPTWS